MRGLIRSSRTMKAELAKKWLGKLTRLNPASGRGQCRRKAPHKPLLLLCIVNLAEEVWPTEEITTTDGSRVRVCPLGAGSWIWEEA